MVGEADAVRRKIGVTAQDATLDEILTGRENLELVGRLGGLRRGEASVRAEDLLAQFELLDAADRLLKTYSGGMRRRADGGIFTAVRARDLVARPRRSFVPWIVR